MRFLVEKRNYYGCDCCRRARMVQGAFLFIAEHTCPQPDIMHAIMPLSIYISASGQSSKNHQQHHHSIYELYYHDFLLISADEHAAI